ncbi:ankyrin repeat domain-containing protein EMB506, chloroplastic-like isoform X3 [Ricinus communis]|uniref:ankyrin repeat domain-containing protein EMB506, chloroplastic-like isoform X3 n=1 Tax=Ricinus communis TaxID=3988 RepID=UPI00201A55A4|nr:ankyrin repeat domain-containing protein EMB506, chloroplastic-like isoform X3 [Ricinus communis]
MIFMVVSEAYTSIIQAKWKPLQTLALSGQIRFMDKLLADGLNIDSGDKDGLTALQLAIVGKEEAAISHLLRKGANPHVKGDGASSLHYAVQIGALQTVKLLIKYNVEDNSQVI